MILEKGIDMGILYAEQVEYMDLDEMQETHENEIAIINEIDKLATKYQMEGTGREALEEKLDAYIAHVREHFEREEELMEAYDFHAYDMHKLAHDMFLIDLQYATNQWKRYGDIDRVVSFVRKSPEWIVMHIGSVDAPTAAFLARRMGEE